MRTPTVAVLDHAGHLTLTRLRPAPPGRPWHHGLSLARTGAGSQFWTRPTPGPLNFPATILADTLGAERLTGLLTGTVLICGSAGDDATPETIPPLVLAMHHEPQPLKDW